MNAARLWTLVRLELHQRVRSVAWYVLLGVFGLLLIGATFLSFMAFGGEERWGPGVYSTVVYITLLLVLLVSPTLSGNSINGDRDAATLASVQVTLATTAEILFGKFIAAWITGLAFVVVAAPFLAISATSGDVHPATALVSLLVLIVEAGIVAAIGVALSGIMSRPLFSVATTYLVVAALAVGTAIAFGLVGSAVTSEVTVTSRDYVSDTQGEPQCVDDEGPCWDDPERMVCGEPTTYTYRVGRYDTVWWLLSANPFVILTDATPVQFDRDGNVNDLFGQFKVGIRYAQMPPDLEESWDACAPYAEQPEDYQTPEELLAETIPSWFVGLGLQIVLAVGLMWGAWARTRTPARALPQGTRIA